MRRSRSIVDVRRQQQSAEVERSPAGQELIDPKRFLNLDTNPLTAGLFQADNNCMHYTATGFVAMVTTSADDPPHITLKQARTFAHALFTGEPEKGSVLANTARELAGALLPGGKG